MGDNAGFFINHIPRPGVSEAGSNCSVTSQQQTKNSVLSSNSDIFKREGNTQMSLCQLGSI